MSDIPRDEDDFGACICALDLLLNGLNFLCRCLVAKVMQDQPGRTVLRCLDSTSSADTSRSAGNHDDLVCEERHGFASGRAGIDYCSSCEYVYPLCIIFVITVDSAAPEPDRKWGPRRALLHGPPVPAFRHHRDDKRCQRNISTTHPKPQDSHRDRLRRAAGSQNSRKIVLSGHYC